VCAYTLWVTVLQHLTDEPRRIVKVVLVMRTPNALSEHIAATLGPETAMFAERSSDGSSLTAFPTWRSAILGLLTHEHLCPTCRDAPLAEPGSYLIPPQLCLLCQGETGRLYSFGLNLRDTFSAVRDSGKLTAVRPSDPRAVPVRPVLRATLS